MLTMNNNNLDVKLTNQRTKFQNTNTIEFNRNIFNTKKNFFLFISTVS